jgi:4-carboxymuconolactone decarboxylase
VTDGADGVRLAPLPREEWDDDVRNALTTAYTEQGAQRFFATGDDEIPVPNVLGALMHHPTLAGPFLTYNNVLLRTPALEHRERELLILRVAWRTNAPYEWVQHVRIATGLGVTPEEIDAIGTDDGSWSPLEALLLAATDQLIDYYRIGDATWAALAELLDERQLVELVFVVGTYTGLAMAFNSFGLQLDPDLLTVTTTMAPELQE